MIYNYKFTNVGDLANISYKITFPTITGGQWLKNAGYMFIKKTTIKVMIKDCVIDKKEITPMTRILLEDSCKISPREMYISPSNLTSPFQITIHVCPIQIRDSFAHLMDKQIDEGIPLIDYEVICKVEIDPNPSLKSLYMATNQYIKPNINGFFRLEHINLHIKEKELIVDDQDKIIICI